MINTLTDGERDILNEQNRDAYLSELLEWENMSDSEREDLIEHARLEAIWAEQDAQDAPLTCPMCGEYLAPPTPHSCGELEVIAELDEEGYPF